MSSFKVQFRCLNEYKKIRNEASDLIKTIVPSNYFFMEVALNEAINNALIHGMEIKDFIITLKIKKEDNKLVIKVLHNGVGFPGNELLQKLRKKDLDKCNKHLSVCSGRGLLIMDAASDYLTFNENGTEVTLIKNY